MQRRIVRSLSDRQSLMDWSVQHVSRRGAQLYVLPERTEAKRTVLDEVYAVDVLRKLQDENGNVFCGSGNATLLAGDDIEAALDSATLSAGFVYNLPYRFPEPANIPEVPLVDDQLQHEPYAVLEELLETLRSEVGRHAAVNLNSAEFFAEAQTIHLINSRGIDVEQTATNLYLEWVFTAERNGHQLETFVDITRRRRADVDLRAHAARHARYVVDLLSAGPPGDYSGPVVLRDEILGSFVNASMLKMLSSGESRYKKETPWEIGQSVFPMPVKGDPFTLWANRRLPFGTNSNRFDSEGLPAQRVPIIQDNKLANFTADQRYAEYLDIPPTGAFGAVELPPGTTSASDLVSDPFVEIVAFSWFNPNILTGDFASEIRQGYFVDGDKRTPFRGGMLVGNVLSALANVRWSAEVGFFGDYVGPTTARFGELVIAGG